MLEEIKILIDNKINIIEKAIVWQKDNYPERTKQYDKCSRDIGYIIDAYINDMSENSSNNIINIASKFWIDGTRQIISYETEFKVHEYIVSYINNELFENEESKIFLNNLKEILFSIIKSGPINTHKFLDDVKTIQRCQRNFDLSKTVSRETAEWLLEIGYSTPTKQNLNTFEIVCVTDRNIIRKCAEAATNSPSEQIHLTNRLKDQLKSKRMQNPQTDSNLLFLYFIRWDDIDSEIRFDRDPGPEPSHVNYRNQTSLEIGISSGAISIAAASAGMKTGFCKCFDENALPEEVWKPFGLNPLDIQLMLGVGYPLYDDHTLHTDGEFYSSSFDKIIDRKIII